MSANPYANPYAAAGELLTPDQRIAYLQERVRKLETALGAAQRNIEHIAEQHNALVQALKERFG